MALQNLFGDLGLESTLQKIAVYLAEIANNLGRTYPDTNGNLRTVVSSGTVTTVSTVTSQSQMSGYSTAYDQYCQMQIGANAIRSQISVS